MRPSLPSFLRFRAVPLRARGDGWTPALQRQFILLLATGAGVDEAARRLGRSRQTAYVLRRRPDAESFAAAWNAAVNFAREAAVAGRRTPAFEYGFDTLLVPRFYRGRLIGFVQREDVHGAMRTYAMLERLTRSIEEPIEDFETLVERAVEAAKTDKADVITV